MLWHFVGHDDVLCTPVVGFFTGSHGEIDVMSVDPAARITSPTVAVSGDNEMGSEGKDAGVHSNASTPHVRAAGGQVIVDRAMPTRIVLDVAYEVRRRKDAEVAPGVFDVCDMRRRCDRGN